MNTNSVVTKLSEKWSTLWNDQKAAAPTGLAACSRMDSEAHTRVTPAERVGIMFGGCCADMLVNYPLWIVAKRLSAGLGLPAVSEIYKGSTSLLVAFGPMVLLQDGSTGELLRHFEGKIQSQTVAHATAACISGGIGALFVGSQIEGMITHAHATKQTVAQAAGSMYRTGGLSAIALPYGALAMVGREVPYAGSLFFLSGWIRSRVHGTWPVSDEPGLAASRVPRDMLSAAVTASIAGPLSQAPSVVAAYQQAHQVSLSSACQRIAAAGGAAGFFGGLIPRTLSLAGSLFVMPFTVETLQPMVERMRM